MSAELCDYCRTPVYVEGVLEPRYIHNDGSVFCRVATATVDGLKAPRRAEGNCD